MVCQCGAAALYRVGELGYCKQHHALARLRVMTMGNPRRAKSKTKAVTRLVHKAKLTPADKLERQKQLKANPTEAELVLKRLLAENAKTKGMYKFQPIIHGFIPDFACIKARLIIEVDGSIHTTTACKRKDRRKDYILKEKGWEILRFPNTRIFGEPSKVMHKICLVQCARLDHTPDASKRF